MSTQRQLCNEKGRVDLLNKIGFEWQLIETSDWEVMYQRPLTYKKKHGTTVDPRGYEADPKLANWVSAQRQFCKEKDRIAILNAIGFVRVATERKQHTKSIITRSDIAI